jgi:hypothetical protein
MVLSAGQRSEEGPMLKLTSSICIDAPVANVWAALSDLGAIHLWV